MENQSDQELLKQAYEALLRIWEEGLENYPESAHSRVLEALRERLTARQSL